MAFNLTPWIDQQFLDNNANPLSFGKIETYVAGSSTPLQTYTDASGGTPNTNPIILDSTGRADIWLSTDSNYKFIIKDSNNSVIRTVDDISSTGGAAVVNTDRLVKVTSNDTIADYLNNKLDWKNGLSASVSSDGGNVEILSISADNNWNLVYDSVFNTSANWDDAYVIASNVSANGLQAVTEYGNTTDQGIIITSGGPTSLDDLLIVSSTSDHYMKVGDGAGGSGAFYLTNDTDSTLANGGSLVYIDTFSAGFKAYNTDPQGSGTGSKLNLNGIGSLIQMEVGNIVEPGKQIKYDIAGDSGHQWSFGNNNIKFKRGLFQVGTQGGVNIGGLILWGDDEPVTTPSAELRSSFLDLVEPRLLMTSGGIRAEFNCPVSGSDPIQNVDFATKQYVDTNDINGDSVYTTVNTNSANWQSTYSTVNANSANWDTEISEGEVLPGGYVNKIVTLDDLGQINTLQAPYFTSAGFNGSNAILFPDTSNVHIVGISASGGSDSLNFTNTSAYGDTDGCTDIRLTPTGGLLHFNNIQKFKWDANGVDLHQRIRSMQPFEGGSSVGLTALAFDQNGVVSDGTSLVSAGQDVYTTVNTNSANWDSTYSTVNANSATWSSGLQTLQEVTDQGNTTNTLIHITSGQDLGGGIETSIQLSNPNPQGMLVGNQDGTGQFYITNDTNPVTLPNGGYAIGFTIQGPSIQTSACDITVQSNDILLNNNLTTLRLENPGIVRIATDESDPLKPRFLITSGGQAGFNTTVSGSDPLTDQDFITKAYFENNSAGGAGSLQTCHLTNCNGVVSFGGDSTQYPRYTYFSVTTDILDIDRMKIYAYSASGSVDYQVGLYQVNGANIDLITSGDVTITAPGIQEVTLNQQTNLVAGVNYYVGIIRQSTTGDVQLAVESGLATSDISFQGAGITTPFNLPTVESTKTPLNYSVWAFLYASAGGPGDPSNWSSITVTNNFTASKNQLVLCDTSSNDITVTLPSASININREIIVKKIDILNDVFISSSDLIDGQSSIGLKTNYSSISCVSDGTTWWIR